MLDLRIARLKPVESHSQTRGHIRSAERLNRFDLADDRLLIFHSGKVHNRIRLAVERNHSNGVAVGQEIDSRRSGFLSQLHLSAGHRP